MNNKDKAKELISEQLKYSDTFMLSKISPRCQELSISNDDIDNALLDLKSQRLIAIENIRGDIWMSKIIKI